MKWLSLLLILASPVLLYSSDAKWTKLYKGVDYSEYISGVEGKFGDEQIRAHVMRVDLREEGVSFLVSKPDEDKRTLATKPSTYLKENELQVVINGTGYSPVRNQRDGFAYKYAKGFAYYKGVQYGEFGERSDAALVVRKDGVVDILYESEVLELMKDDKLLYGLGGWMHQVSTSFKDNIWYIFGGLISGVRSSIIVDNGKSVVRDSIKKQYARTVLGLSKDKRYLYMVVVDGPPSSGFWFSDKISVGIDMTRLSELMVEVGSWRAMSLDGSGSSTMVVEGLERGGASVLNLPSDYNTGEERAVGTNLGVYAQKLEGEEEALGKLNMEMVIDRAEGMERYRDKLEKEGLADFREYLGQSYELDGVSRMMDIFRQAEDIELDNLKPAGGKPTGASEGGVYRDRSDVVWFVKEGQHPEYEYLAAGIMHLLFGELAPKVKLVDGEKKLTASRQILGFIHKSEVSGSDRRYGDGGLALALDWLGVVDRHGKNMGYVRSERGLEAIRVDYDHAFSFAEKYRIRDAHLYEVEFDEEYLKKKLSEYSLEEIGGGLKQIAELPDEYLRRKFMDGVNELIKNKYEINIDKLDRILSALLERKQKLAKLYEEVKGAYEFLYEGVGDREAVLELYSKREISSILDKLMNERKLRYQLIKRIMNLVDLTFQQRNALEGKLSKAMDRGSFNDFKKLIGLGDDVARLGLRVSLLYRGEEEAIYVLSQFSDVKSNASYWEYVLRYGRVKVFRWLIENGADLSLSKDAFSWAVSSGNLEMVKYALDNGVKIQEILFEAFNNINDESSRIDIFEYLFKRAKMEGERLNAKLVFNILRITRAKELRVLIDSGLDLEKDSRRVLIRAVKEGDIEYVKFLVEEGVPIKGLGLIDMAIRYRKWELASYLLSKGEVIDISPYSDRKFLVNAIRNGDVEHVKFLVEAGVPIKDMGLMDVATLYGRWEIVRYLLAKGEVITEKHFLENRRHVGAYKADEALTLLSSGVRDKKLLQDLLSEGVERMYPNLVKEMLNRGAVAGASDLKAVIVNSLYCGNGNGCRSIVFILKLLIEAGADVNLIDKKEVQYVLRSDESYPGFVFEVLVDAGLDLDGIEREDVLDMKRRPYEVWRRVAGKIAAKKGW